MITCALAEIFDIKYGNSLELVKLKKHPDGVNFVARTQKNNGVVAKVVKPFSGRKWKRYGVLLAK